MHGAWYVSPEHARQLGHARPELGLPGPPRGGSRRAVIDTIKGGTFVFSYSQAASRPQTVRASLAPKAGAGDGGKTVAAKR